MNRNYRVKYKQLQRQTCTKPCNDHEINASEHVDATPNELNDESINEALNVSNNSSSPINGNIPIPTNASNSGTSELSRSNQLNDKESVLMSTLPTLVSLSPAADIRALPQVQV